MKKIIVSAAIILSAVVLSSSCSKQNDVKPTSAFSINPFSDKQDIGSAD